MTDDVFELAFDKFKEAHKSLLDLDRKKLLPAKAAGEALIVMRQNKRCTVDQLLDTLGGLGVNISQDTHNRYVRVASRWGEMVAIAEQRNIDLETLGYMEALDLLPPSEHAQKVKAGKRKTKAAAEPGGSPQPPPVDWTGRVITGGEDGQALPLGDKDAKQEPIETKNEVRSETNDSLSPVGQVIPSSDDKPPPSKKKHDFSFSADDVSQSYAS